MNRYKALLVVAGVAVGVGLLLAGISSGQAGKPAKTDDKLARFASAHTLRLERALKAIDGAGKAIDAGDKKTAKAKLEKAKSLIAATHKALLKHRAASRIVNIFCPMMGTKLDPTKVPTNLTRIYKGRAVGFCCPGCPAAWDKLTNEQKGEKLKKSLPPKKLSAAAPQPARTFANIRCPMMGSPINPEKVPASLTRTFKGRKVAFCCGGCPTAWDKLTNSEKQTKLSAALPE